MSAQIAIDGHDLYSRASDPFAFVKSRPSFVTYRGGAYRVCKHPVENEARFKEATFRSDRLQHSAVPLLER